MLEKNRFGQMLDEARMFGRYVVGLREFVRTPLGREECRRRIGEQLRGQEEVAEAVLRALEGCPGGELMAGVWRDGGTLRVRRQEPYATAAAEILPLHLLRGA